MIYLTTYKSAVTYWCVCGPERLVDFWACFIQIAPMSQNAKSCFLVRSSMTADFPSSYALLTNMIRNTCWSPPSFSLTDPIQPANINNINILFLGIILPYKVYKWYLHFQDFFLLQMFVQLLYTLNKFLGLSIMIFCLLRI